MTCYPGSVEYGPITLCWLCRNTLGFKAVTRKIIDSRVDVFTNLNRRVKRLYRIFRSL